MLLQHGIFPLHQSTDILVVFFSVLFRFCFSPLSQNFPCLHCLIFSFFFSFLFFLCHPRRTTFQQITVIYFPPFASGFTFTFCLCAACLSTEPSRPTLPVMDDTFSFFLLSFLHISHFLCSFRFETSNPIYFSLLDVSFNNSK